MSQYNVEHWHDAFYEDVEACCRIMWGQQPYPSQHWPNFSTYYRAVLEDGATDMGSIVCRRDGFVVGALSIGDLETNSHFPGTGIIVYNTVVDQRYPQATRLLYRYLIQMIQAGGGSWYQTTRRVSEFEFSSKFRRVHNGQEL